MIMWWCGAKSIWLKSDVLCMSDCLRIKNKKHFTQSLVENSSQVQRSSDPGAWMANLDQLVIFIHIYFQTHIKTRCVPLCTITFFFTCRWKNMWISFPDPEFSGLLHFCHIFCSSGLSLFIVGPFMCRRACAQFLFPSLDSQGQCTAHVKQIKSGFIWLPQRWQMVMVGKANVQIYYNTYISWFLYSVFYSVFWNADLYIKELKLCFFSEKISFL